MTIAATIHRSRKEAVTAGVLCCRGAAVATGDAASETRRQNMPALPTHAMKTPPRTFCERSHWWVRLEDWGTFVAFIGSGLIAASCAIFLHLWTGTRAAVEGYEPPSFWRTLAERGSAPQVGTGCAAAIRTAILLQIGVITPTLPPIPLCWKYRVHVFSTRQPYLSSVPRGQALSNSSRRALAEKHVHAR